MKAKAGGKNDQGKLRFDLIEPGFLEEIAKVLTDGADTHGDYSYRQVENAKARFVAALHRHLNAFQKGEHIAPETTHHMAHIACNAMFLWWFSTNGRTVKTPKPS